MVVQALTPKKSLNKAFLRVKPHRAEIEQFKTQLCLLLDRINLRESEEFHKNLIIDFLQSTYYKPDYFINTKGRNDLVVHNGNKATHSVGVIIETKSPVNKSEMITPQQLNRKAFQELVLYYLRERISLGNLEVKHLIATNINEWFIFDVQVFDRLFAQNKELVKQFKDFENNRLAETKTDFFYTQIAAPFIENLQDSIEFTYFNLQDYEKTARDLDRTNDHRLTALYKVLSPAHLLKLPFANDSNSLDKSFYSELLHIIGLVETGKSSSKKLIERAPVAERNSGTLLEDAIIQLRSLDKLDRLSNRRQYGATKDEQLFNVALELSITWMNRILFLKLLEAQLLGYQRGDSSYAFLNFKRLKNFDDLNSLFFQVLARKPEDRNEDVKEAFAKVPYLNSSLFEPTELEHATLFISNLRDDKPIPLSPSTVLKDLRGKKKTGEMPALEYLFAFLEAYDFSSEGFSEIQEDNKTLINASVLGLIFEKINGYKDGSFFTPGFITMYMSRETIRRAVLQKFNQIKGWNCADFNALYNKIEDLNEANRIVNSLKICDPAVGSGHFLVSSLNELIAVKNDLRILQDPQGRRLKEYFVEVANDELIVTDQDGELFEYHPNNHESQRVQGTLFHEKQTIIENCLFGVDINPNSVKICRLRLWIELLKNAYYIQPSERLQTLPNIDINIKCGNSLVSRFDLKSDLKQALKNSQWTIDSYRNAVATYRNAKDKTHKREMEKLIETIKSDFRSTISLHDPQKKSLEKLRGELIQMTTQTRLFDQTPKQKTAWEKRVKELTQKVKKIESNLQEIKDNQIYDNAFEWRFEFPEVLNDQGDFVGFDAVIANPPYVYRNMDNPSLKGYFSQKFFNTTGNFDLYKFFIELSLHIVKSTGINCLITNSSFLLQTSFEKTRLFLLNNSNIEILIPLGGKVFDEATVDSAVYLITRMKLSEQTKVIVPQKPSDIANTDGYYINPHRFITNQFSSFDYLLNDREFEIVDRLLKNFPKLSKGFDFGVGINTGYIKSQLTSDVKLDERFHAMVPGTGVEKYGPVTTEGYIMYDKSFVKSTGKLGRALPDERFFTEPKILVVRTRNLSLHERIIATIDRDQKYNLNRISNIISKEGYSLVGLLGLINSRLFNWLYSKRFFDYEIKPIYLKNSPLANVNDPLLNKLVNEISTLDKKTQTTQRAALESQIDQLVYQLYGLSEEEIEIVENSVG